MCVLLFFVFFWKGGARQESRMGVEGWVLKDRYLRGTEGGSRWNETQWEFVCKERRRGGGRRGEEKKRRGEEEERRRGREEKRKRGEEEEERRKGEKVEELEGIENDGRDLVVIVMCVCVCVCGLEVVWMGVER